MSIFSSLFGTSESNEERHSNVNWVPLSDLKQLDEIIAESFERPVIIFKHSTTCGISRMAFKQFENAFDLNDKVTSYYLDLLTYRMISNEVATRFGIRHESPQLLLIKDGKCVYHVSHGAIDVENLKPQLELR